MFYIIKSLKMGFEGGPGGPGEGGNGGNANSTNTQLANVLSSEYRDFCLEIIEDPTSSIEYKIQAVKELIEDPQGLAKLNENNRKNSILMEAIKNEDVSIDDKIRAIKELRKDPEGESRFNNFYGLPQIPDIQNLNNMGNRAISILAESNEISTLFTKDKKAYFWSFRDNHQLKEGKRKIENNNNGREPYHIYPAIADYIIKIQEQVKKVLRESGVIDDDLIKGISLGEKKSGINPSNFIKDRNGINIDKMEERIFSSIKNYISKYITTKNNEQNILKAEKDIVPELFLIKSYGTINEDERQTFKDAFVQGYRTLKGKDLHIYEFVNKKKNETIVSQNQKILEKIFEEFGREMFDDETYNFNRILSDIEGWKNTYNFILLPEKYDEAQKMDNVLSDYNVHAKERLKALNNCFTIDDLHNYMKSYDIKINNENKIFSNTLLDFSKKNYNYDIYNLSFYRFDAIKTFLLTVEPKKSIDGNAIEKYIFEKIFSTKYEYSDTNKKKNLIKYFIKKWNIDENLRNTNENGLNLDEFLEIFYKEVNMAFSQNFQNWNNMKFSNFGPKSYIIETTINMAIENAKYEKDFEKRKKIIFNLLRAPICHVKKDGIWTDISFTINDGLLNGKNDISKGRWVEGTDDRKSLLDNIKIYILSTGPSREFKTYVHEKHKGVYNDGGKFCIKITGDLRFILSSDDKFFTIKEITDHQNIGDALNDAA